MQFAPKTKMMRFGTDADKTGRIVVTRSTS